MKILKLLAFFKSERVIKLTSDLGLLIHQNILKRPFVNSLKLSASRYLLIAICHLLTGLTWFNNQAVAQKIADSRPQEQTEILPLRIGQVVPKDFWTREHLFYVDGDTVRRNLSQYRGKLLVLDFWATWCTICLAQMKEKQALFAKYPEEAAFLLVNPAVTKDTYQTVSDKHDKIASLTNNGAVESIILDDYLQKLFPNRVYPRYVWIGPRSNLIALTMALSVREGHLKDLIAPYSNSHGKK